MRDHAAFAGSLRRMLDWDFDRIVPGHGQIVAREGRAVFRDAFADFLPAGDAVRTG